MLIEYMLVVIPLLGHTPSELQRSSLLLCAAPKQPRLAYAYACDKQRTRTIQIKTKLRCRDTNVQGEIEREKEGGTDIDANTQTRSSVDGRAEPAQEKRRRERSSGRHLDVVAEAVMVAEQQSIGL
jgi:hypothetical protein